MKKTRHNKKRNTAVLYEVLVRELTGAFNSSLIMPRSTSPLRSMTGPLIAIMRVKSG